MGTAAVPTTLHSVARAVPDINEVARNPAPIDDRVDWDDHGKPALGDTNDLSSDDLKKLKELMKQLLSGRAVDDDAESIVVDRTTPNFHHSAKNPVEIRP
jgi:hypothetical protein